VKADTVRKAASRTVLWLVVAVSAVVLYQRAATVPEPMEPDELARTGRKLASDAQEASRLARALATGQLTLHFAVEQHEQLEQDVEDVRKDLDRPPPPGREEPAQRLREAAQRLGEMLLEVPLHMADAQAMSRIAADEAAIAADIGAGDGT
jgi:hypothetical protein